jgi:hypothetical protein
MKLRTHAGDVALPGGRNLLQEVFLMEKGKRMKKKMYGKLLDVKLGKKSVFPKIYHHPIS